jgi:hypothetical protein
MTLTEVVTNQALAELPQIMDKDEREQAVNDYINKMTHLELLELLERCNLVLGEGHD